MIDSLIKKYNGTVHDANEFWPDGALDPNEVIVELPRDSVYPEFMREINATLDENNPIQYIADSKVSRWFLYYSNAVL